MRSIICSLVFLSLACASQTPHAPIGDADPAPSPVAPHRALVAVDRASGDRLWLVRPGGDDCRIEEIGQAGRTLRSAELRCGSRILQLDDRVLVIDDGQRKTTALPLDTFVPETSALLDTEGDWTLEWSARGITRRGPSGASQLPPLRAPRLLSNGTVIGVSAAAEGETLVLHSAGGVTDLLAGSDVSAIESWDLDPKEGELVFAARRRDGRMDVGIAATDGSGVNWIPGEPGDEYGVTWAPRGNKVTWMIDSPAGVVMRTAHIPTGYQLSVPLGYVSVEAVAWEPAAEKVYIVMSSPAESRSVTSIRYGGEDRAVIIAPAERIGRVTDQLASVPGSVLLPPGRIQYGHRYPVTILTGDGDYGWDPALAAAAADAAAAILWLPDSSDEVIARAREELGEIGWVDRDEITVR